MAIDTTFENFQKLFFDGLNPEEYNNQIYKLKKYIGRISDDFYKEYTYCTGCRQMVKKNESYAEQSRSLSFQNCSLIKCKKCNTTWHIRDDDDDE